MSVAGLPSSGVGVLVQVDADGKWSKVPPLTLQDHFIYFYCKNDVKGLLHGMVN